MSNSEDEIQWRIPDELKRSSSAIRYPPSAITAQLIRHYSAAIRHPLLFIRYPAKQLRHSLLFIRHPAKLAIYEPVPF